VEKKIYVAYSLQGNHNSGQPKTQAECLAWAQNLMAKNQTVTECIIAEAKSRVKLTAPPVQIFPYVASEEEQRGGFVDQPQQEYPTTKRAFGAGSAL
jgi:hypothetical protein